MFFSTLFYANTQRNGDSIHEDVDSTNINNKYIHVVQYGKYTLPRDDKHQVGPALAQVYRLPFIRLTARNRHQKTDDGQLIIKSTLLHHQIYITYCQWLRWHKEMLHIGFY